MNQGQGLDGAVDRLELFARASRAIVTAPTRDGAVAAATQAAFRVLGARRVMALVGGDGERPPIAQHLGAARACLRFEDVPATALGLGEAEAPCRSVLAVPAAAEAHHGWLLLADRADGGRFTEADEATALALGACVGAACDRHARALAAGAVEAAWRATEAEAQQALRLESLGRLAGGVAHDFNNLLTVVLSYGQLLLDEHGRVPGLGDDLREVVRAAERGRDLTRHLLAFSRQQVLEPAVVSLGGVVRGMERMLRRLLGEHIELDIRVRGDGRVLADPSQVEQVVMNLAVNARDSMPAGGTITIEVADVAAGGGERPMVSLRVSDGGVGIDPATRARIFEPFFTTKPRGKGSGLGLATVHGIVQQSGGRIAVESEPGRGTTFHVLFPRSDAAPADRASGAPGALRPPGTETVLVVEDDEAIRSVMQRVLQQHGYTVLAAARPEEALDLVSARPVDLLLTDVIMPGMSGFDLADRAAAARAGLKVLYVTGYGADLFRAHAREAEGRLVPKPVTPAALLARVRAALDQRDGATAA